MTCLTLLVLCVFQQQTLTLGQSEDYTDGLPPGWMEMLESRKSLKSAKINVDVEVAGTGGPEAPFEDAGKKYSHVYRFVLSGDNLTARVIEKTAVEGSNYPFEYRIAFTDDVTRLIPDASDSLLICDEYSLPFDKASELNSMLKSSRFDLRAVGVTYNSFTSLATEGLSYVQSLSSLGEPSWRRTNWQGKEVVDCVFSFSTGARIRYILDQSFGGVPICIQVLYAEKGNEPDLVYYIESDWEIFKDGLHLPIRVVRRNPRDQELEKWELSYFEVNESVASSEFDWQALGIEKGMVVQSSELKDGQIVKVKKLKEWDGAKFIDHTPILLDALGNAPTSRSVLWAVLGGVVVVSVALLVVGRTIRNRNSIR